jgi:uncharacterized membrane protein YfcA
METAEPASKQLNAVRSPLVFNAFIAISLGGVTGAVLYSNLPEWFRIGMVTFFCLWVLAVMFWTNHQANKDIRRLVYGPKEHLEESRMAYEHKLELAKLAEHRKG